MSRQVKCDRCGKVQIVTQGIRPEGWVKAYRNDLCPDCETDLENFFSGLEVEGIKKNAKTKAT